VHGLAAAPEAMLGPQRPIADPGRPLELEGTLEETVAAGLGLDLAALQRRAASDGIALALQRTAVRWPAPRPPRRQRARAGAAARDDSMPADAARRRRAAGDGAAEGARRARRGRADELDALLDAAPADADALDDDEEPQR
jgi:hypothetical protein